MKNFKERSRESRDNALNKQVATKIIDGISKLSKGKHQAKGRRRWVWELLQNAKDVSTDNGVNVEIEVSPSSIEFRHNGKPFLLDNITYLIEQVSTKERAEDKEERAKIKTTGKFGTGFMTTHLLSKIVTLNGTLKDDITSPVSYRSFDLKLDRSPSSVPQMVENIKNSMRVFEKLDSDNSQPLTNYDEGTICDTVFNYPLNESSIKVAHKGIQDLKDNIPLTLVIVRELNQVKIIDFTTSNSDTPIETYYKEISETKLNDNISQYKISKTCSNTSESTEYNFLLLRDKDDYVQVIAEFKEEDSIKSFEPPHPNRPLLHCVFPLIGSEGFGFPVYFNSPVFNPTEPRDGIFLSQIEDVEEDKDITENKQLIETAVDLYIKLASFIVEEWQNVFWLINIKTPEQDVDKTWYKEKVLDTIRPFILDLKLVENIKGEKIKFGEAKIPYPQKDAELLWDFISFKYQKQFPQRENVATLSSFIKTAWGKDCQYTLEDLAKDVAGYKDIISISYDLKLNLDLTFQWLNELIALILERNKELLNDYAIIPNQKYGFKKLNELYRDLGIPPELKYIFGQFSGTIKLDIHQILIHSLVDQSNLEISKKRDITYVSNRINSILDIDETSDSYNIRNGLFLLSQVLFKNTGTDEQAIQFSKQYFLSAFTQTFLYKERNKDLEYRQQDCLEWKGFNWSKIHKYLAEAIAKKISYTKKIPSLQNILHPNVNPVYFLNGFINFLHTFSLGDDSIINRFNIFPTQSNYLLKTQKQAFIDSSIPESLKDSATKLRYNIRKSLLHKEISLPVSLLSSFDKKNSTQVLEVINNRIADAINELEKPNIETEELTEEQKETKINTEKNNLTGILIFLAGFKETLPSKRAYIWNCVKTIYPELTSDITPYQITLEPHDETIWTNADKWILNKILSKFEECKTLDEIHSFLGFDNFIDTCTWLDTFIHFINQEDFTLLDKYSIIPNQKKRLSSKSSISVDSNIPQEFKIILHLLNGKDWKNNLLFISENNTHTLFNQTINTYRNEGESIIEDKKITAEKIAREIDSAFRKSTEEKKTSNDFSEALNLLITWIEVNRGTANFSENDLENWFSWFEKKKAQLMLDVFDDRRDITFKIIRSDKFDELSRLAEDDTISKEAIEKFANNPALFERTANKIAKEEENKRKQKAKEKYYTSLGTHAEGVFKNIFSESLGYEVVFGGYGRDFTITHKDSCDKVYYVELKSKSPRAFEQDVSMTKPQVIQAKLNSKNFALCIIPEKGDEVNEETITSLAKFLPNIGVLASKSLDKSNEVTDATSFNENGVWLDFQHTIMKFKIEDDTWRNGDDFSTFIQHIETYFKKK